ncbi:MAG: SDR family NAD(P)-dependent oxidoreductase, partial [Thermoplasmata archaeon]
MTPGGDRFRGEAAVVTGASRGIGAAIARALADEGFRLVLAGRDREALDSVGASLARTGAEVTPWIGDLLEEGAVDRLVDAARRAVGVPYLLVNNAGAVRPARLERRSESEVAAELRLDLGIPIALVRAFLPDLLRRGRGQILNIGSGITDLPLGRLAVYSAAKSGLRGFSVAMDRELRRRGIRSTVLEPTFVRTGLGGGPGAGPSALGGPTRWYRYTVLAPEVVGRYAVQAL